MISELLYVAGAVIARENCGWVKSENYVTYLRGLAVGVLSLYVFDAIKILAHHVDGHVFSLQKRYLFLEL